MFVDNSIQQILQQIIKYELYIGMCPLNKLRVLEYDECD